MNALKAGSGIAPFHDGSLAGLIASMDQAGIWRSVVLSIATRPEQSEVIIDWSKSIASERIIPFASVMPTDEQAAALVRKIAAAGIKGVKIHPYYQRFVIDNPARLLFGSDSPWVGQKEELALLKGLELPAELLQAVLEKNALALLNGAGL